MHRRGLPGLSLAEFAAAAWQVIEPQTPLKWNWHIDALCAHVQAVLEGGVSGQPWAQNLLVNVPPGTMKSLVLSVFAPAWVWLWRPTWRAVFTSANPRVALRDSMRCRDLLRSDWYSDTFKPCWRLADDQDAKGHYRTSEGGSRLAISVGSSVTGDRADCLVVDDPLDAADAPSAVIRESVNYWWDSALANRVADPSRSTRLVIMQRLHEDDLSGHLLRQGGFEHLCLPMEFERDAVRTTFLGWRDPRWVEGQLLFPDRFPVEVLAQERRRLGSAGYAGQMQQRPTPAAGNRFQRSWWKFHTGHAGAGARGERPRGCSAVDPVPLPKHFDDVLGSWDCAFKGSDDSDYVVGVVVAASGADRYVLALDRAKMTYSETKRAIARQRLDWPGMSATLIEDKANGPAVIESLQQELVGIVAVNPMGGKESRAAPLEPEVEAGSWYLPEGAEWLGDWVEEFASFPLGRHDDIVDAVSQAATRLRDSDVAYARAMLAK